MTRLLSQMMAVALASWLLGPAASAAQVEPPAVEWERTYSWELFGWEPQPMEARDFQQTRDGGYILLGSNKAYLIKTDPTGEVDWCTAYRVAGGGGAVRQNADGGYVVAFNQTRDTGSVSAYLMQTDSRGNMTWSKYLYSAREEVQWLEPTRDGGYIIGGSSAVLRADAFLMKTDSTGDVIWSRTFGEAQTDDWFYSCTQVQDGGYIFGGATGSFGCLHDGSYGAYLIKTDIAGHQKWLKTYADSVSFKRIGALSPTADGGYVLSGLMWSFSLLKVDANGEEEWRRRYKEGEGNFSSTSVRQTCDGGYIIGGLRFDGDCFPSLCCCVMKANPTGDEIWWWKGQINVNADLYVFKVTQTMDGGYAMFGSQAPEPSPRMLYLAKLAPDGDCRPQNWFFRRGDSGADGVLQLTDAVFTLNHLFLAGPRPVCLDAADADDNGAIQITDAILTLNHLFLGGPALPEPFGSCGADSTPDDLGCAAFPACQ